MYAKADSLNRRLYTSPLWAKTFGAPVSQLTPLTQFALDRAGWNAYRTLGTGAVYNAEYYWAPLAAPDNNDTLLMAAPKQYERHVRNMSGVYPTYGSPSMFGDGDTEADLALVKRNAHRAIWTARGNSIRAIQIFTHDVKNVGGYTGGITADELDAFCDVADSLNVAYMTTGAYVTWVKGYATAVDYPYPASATKLDLYEAHQTAADRVFFKPYGVDNRWIRNIAKPVFPTLPEKPAIFAAVDSGSIAYYQKYGFSLYLPPRCTGTVTVRVLNHATQALIDIAKTVNIATSTSIFTGSTASVSSTTAGGIAITNGAVVDVEYIVNSTRPSNIIKSVTGWTKLLENYTIDMATIRDAEPVIPLAPVPPTQ
jgi:hypothetical protein